MFLSRSVTGTIVNKSACALRLIRHEHAHGSFDTLPPTDIPAGGTGTFVTSTAGLFTGTEGFILYDVVGAEATFEVTWDNPFVGDNVFSQAFRPPPEAAPSPAGTYVTFEPTGDDLEDADDPVVTYELSITPPASDDAGQSGGGSGATDGATPPPDPDAPQQVVAAPGANNTASGVGVLTPPRLSVALNAVSPGDTGKDDSVSGILALVAKRLEGGLDDVWKKGGAAGLWDTTKWKDSDPDERWARAITEQLLGMPYQGAAASYGIFGERKDNLFYGPFSDKAKDPIAPIGSACQHYASLGVLSRGFSLSDLLDQGFSCSEASGTKVIEKGKWFSDAGKKDIAEALKEGLGPGSVYVFNPEPSSNKQREGSHIAFVLRVDKDQKQAQFFDTGGLKVPERTGGAVPRIMEDFPAKGSYDEPFWDKVGTDYYVGMGIVKASSDLEGAIRRLRQTRTVGLARFVLTKKDALFPSAIDAKSPPPELVYVSRLLRMYGDQPDQNFTYARYYWSLRDLPKRDELTAYWVIYAPRNVFTDPDASAAVKAKAKTATAFIDAPRTKKVDDFGVPLHRARVVVLTSLSDGKAKQLQRLYTKAENNKPGQKGDAKSKELYEKPDSFPTNLAKLVDNLAPSQSLFTGSAPTAPPLFQDYAGQPPAQGTVGA